MSTRKRRGGAGSNAPSTVPSTPTSPRRTSLLLRRLRLLPRTQSILFLILLAASLLLIYLRPPPNALLPELARLPPAHLAGPDLLDPHPLPLRSLSHLRNLRPADSGRLLLDAVLTLPHSQPEPATLHIRSPRSIVPSSTASPPSLQALSHALQLRNITSLSVWPLLLPLPPSPSLCARSVARALVRAAGFRSTSRVPANSAVPAVVARAAVTPAALLFKPAPEPYDWEAAVPTAAACRDATGAPKRTCRRLMEILLLAYIAGCAPVAEGELLRASDGQLLLGVPARCFEDGMHWYVSRDVFLAYVAESCELPKGSFERMRALERVPWGVRGRVEELRKIVEEGSAEGRRMCEGRWSFY